MNTINEYYKPIVSEKIWILFNLLLKVYPELSYHVEIQNIYNETGDAFYEILKFDANTIYQSLSTRSEKNKLARSGMTLDERVQKFIKNKYNELIEIDKYFFNYYQNKISENDLHDMNITYKKLKLK